MDYLILAQTAFYAVFALAIFILSILFGIVVFYLIGIARHLRKIAENADEVSNEARERILEIVETLSDLPLVSMLFRKKGTSRSGKSKKESNK